MNRKCLFYGLLFLTVINAPFIAGASEIKKSFDLVQAKGIVNKEEVDGESLRVISFWDDKSSLLAQDGSFITVISNQRPQKLSLVDKKRKIRALSIAFPQYSDRIIFDAKSTAIAVLFNDSVSFGQASQVEELCSLFEKKQSFRDLVVFLRKNLKLKTLEDLGEDKEYADILGRCNSEIFGNDPKVIKGALQVAQRQLQDILQ